MSSAPNTSVSENMDVVDIDDVDDLIVVDKKNKGKKRSEVWNHFTEIPDPKDPRKQLQLCIHCKKRKYKYDSKNGTSTLKNHRDTCDRNPANAHLNKNNNIENYCSATGLGSDGVNKYEMGGLLKFDQESQRLLLAKMIIIDELPFKFVQNQGFVEFCKGGMPWFQIPSRQTIARDCIVVYKKEKANLQAFFKKTKQRISITTDGWTSNQNLSYMVLTAHFVDDEWTLRKRIINFITCPSHKGEEVGLLIEECLKEWEIDSLFTVTVDNATANDKTVAYLRKKFVAKGNAVLQGKYMHVRCVAHIINLIVKNGLKDHIISIDRVRNLVKYIMNSPARELKLRECATKENILTKAFLAKDVATRWNSVYLMLDRAIIFKNAFDRYKVEEPSVRFDFPNDKSDKAYPTDEDWDVASFMAKILENFHTATIRVSGVSYVTANIFLDEIGSIYAFLNQWEKSGNESLQNLAANMKEKFEKYWTDDYDKEKTKANVVFYVASLLDPRYKLCMLKGMLEAMFGWEIGNEIANTAVDVLKEFYEEYQNLNPNVFKFPSSSSGSSLSVSSYSMASRPSTKYVKPRNSLFNQVLEKSGGFEEQSEIDKYLNANLVGPDEFGSNYQILDWWKDHKKDYPILSIIVRDIFAIPISTVASESAFSTSGRVIDDFRSSLKPKTAEALILTQDWLRQGRILTDEEEFEIIEEIEEELRMAEEDHHSMA